MGWRRAGVRNWKVTPALGDEPCLVLSRREPGVDPAEPRSPYACDEDLGRVHGCRAVLARRTREAHLDGLLLSMRELRRLGVGRSHGAVVEDKRRVVHRDAL